MAANAVAHCLTASVIGRDYTHNTVTAGFLLGADVGVSSKANGKSSVIAYHLILAEKGVEGSWSEHLREAARFIVDMTGLPEPIVQLTDKTKERLGRGISCSRSACCALSWKRSLQHYCGTSTSYALAQMSLTHLRAHLLSICLHSSALHQKLSVAVCPLPMLIATATFPL